MATPIVGFRNLLEKGTTSATSETTDHGLAFDGLTYGSWQFAGGTQYLNVVLDTQKPADYFAIGRHNLHVVAGRVRLEGSGDGSTWTAVTAWLKPDGRAQLVTFDTVTYTHYRVAVETGDGGSIGAIAFGEKLELFRGVRDGFTPPMQARDSRILGVTSEGGHSLGRSLVSRAIRFPLVSSNYDQSWMRTTGQEFIDYAETRGFFFAYNKETDPDDVVFVEAEEIRRPSFTGSFRQGLAMVCRGLRDEGERVPDQVTGLAVSPSGDDLVLTWDAVTGADSYNVYRATDEGGPYTEIGTSTDPIFTDATVVAATTYWYQVEPISSAGIGPRATSAPAMQGFYFDSDFTPDASGLPDPQVGAWYVETGEVETVSGVLRSASAASAAVGGLANIGSGNFSARVTAASLDVWIVAPFALRSYNANDPGGPTANQWNIVVGTSLFTLGVDAAIGDTVEIRRVSGVYKVFINSVERYSATHTNEINEIGLVMIDAFDTGSPGSFSGGLVVDLP